MGAQTSIMAEDAPHLDAAGRKSTRWCCNVEKPSL